jgi:DNA mismatch repair protein MutL
MKVEGYVGRPALVRTTRRWQTLLVNGRYVKHAGLTAAVYEAYGTLLPSGKHPFFVLYLTLDPGAVDVNVHPQKLTVRFHREREVAGLVRGAVKQVLFGRLNLIPGTSSSPAPPVREVFPRPGWGGPALSCLSAGQRMGPFGDVDGAGTDRAAGKETAGEPVGLDKTGFLVTEEATAYGEGFPPLTYLSFLPPCYLLASGPEGLYLVDQHAAHERVLFEEYGAALARGGVAGQLLVEPVPVESGAADVSALAGELARYGFVVEPFGEGMALLRAVPAGLSLERARLLLDDLLSCLAAGDSPAREEAALASLACHSAVRAGEPPNMREAVALIKRLAACREPFTCPHGRPTVVCFSRAELARRFGRR